MYLVYLPTNIIFDRLIIEHLFRMGRSFVFMCLAMAIQYVEFGDVLGFFHNTIIFFWSLWILNGFLTFVVKSGYHKLERKIEIVYHSPNNNPKEAGLKIDLPTRLHASRQSHY